MTTPRVVTETVPDSIRAREATVLAHVVERDRVRASIIAVPGADLLGSDSHPQLVYRTE
jgi:hypothetical protein